MKLTTQHTRRVAGRFLDILHCAAPKVLAAGLLMLASLFLASCQRGPMYSGDWRELRRGEKDNRWGYIDHSGKFAIKPQFYAEGQFSEGLARVLPKGKPYGYIDKTGAWVAKPQFKYATDFSGGLAAVADRNGKWGFIDATGKYAILPQFDDAQKFSEGLAAVKNGKLWGYINKTGKFAIEPRFHPSSNFLYWESFFSGGVAVVDAGAPYFELIDRNGNVIKKLKAYRVHPFRDGLALVELPHSDQSAEKVYRFINTTGEFAFPQTFLDAREFSGGLAICLGDGGFGYIDTAGRFVIQPRFAVASDFSEGLAAAKIDSHDARWCYIDKTGRTVIQPLGDGRADKFIGGLAAVDLDCPKGYLAQGAKWGYIDETGKIICTFTKGRSQPW